MAGKKIDRRALQAQKDAEQKELEIQAAEEEVRNAQLYGSEQDVYKAEAKLAKLKGEDYTVPVASGNVQNTGKDVVKDAIAAYNSDGTFDNFYKTLKDAGYNDDSIETIIKENKLEGKKATDWVKNRGEKRTAEATGTPPEVKADEKEADEKVEGIVNEPPAHTPKGIDVKTDVTTETDETNTADENTVAGVTQSNPIDNQLDNQATEDKQNTDEQTTEKTGGQTSNGDESDGDGSGQDDTEAKNFWKKWRAGALRAYPMLQSIGDAISRNARMTADRAALLTGGERDTKAYDPIQVQQAPKSQLAFADAEAGNFDTLKEAIMAGEIDINNAAMALNMTPESLQERFNRSERSQEADVKSKEVGVEQSKENLTQSILQNKQQVRENILFIDEQIRQIDKDINALEGPAFDSYNKVLSDYVNNYTGLQTIGSTTTSSKDDTNNLGGEAGTGDFVKKFVSANVRDTWTHSTGSSDTGTSSKDVLALAALPKGEEYAQMAFEEKNAANAKLIEQLQQQKAQLVQMRDQLKSAYTEATGETATRLNYSPKKESAK
jgi:hypothetical protein